MARSGKRDVGGIKRGASGGERLVSAEVEAWHPLEERHGYDSFGVEGGGVASWSVKRGEWQQSAGGRDIWLHALHSWFKSKEPDPAQLSSMIYAAG